MNISVHVNDYFIQWSLSTTVQGEFYEWCASEQETTSPAFFVTYLTYCLLLKYKRWKICILVDPKRWWTQQQNYWPNVQYSVSFELSCVMLKLLKDRPTVSYLLCLVFERQTYCTHNEWSGLRVVRDLEPWRTGIENLKNWPPSSSKLQEEAPEQQDPTSPLAEVSATGSQMSWARRSGLNPSSNVHAMDPAVRESPWWRAGEEREVLLIPHLSKYESQQESYICSREHV